MKLGCIMLLDHNDIVPQNVKAEDVDLFMVKGNVPISQGFHTADVVIYVDEHGNYKILSSRYF